jgi:hypothetical protein
VSACDGCGDPYCGDCAAREYLAAEIAERNKKKMAFEKSLKGKTRELRRACKAAGFTPGKEGTPLEENQFPISGAFTVMRNGKNIVASDVKAGDTIHEG